MVGETDDGATASSAHAGGGAERAARVVVLVRPRCPTCDAMTATVGRVCAETGTSWTVVDVTAPDADPDLRGEYADVVPVTLVDGREHAGPTVDPAALRAALAG